MKVKNTARDDCPEDDDGWADWMMTGLKRQSAEAMAALERTTIESDDLIAIGRRQRIIGGLTRVVRDIVALGRRVREARSEAEARARNPEIKAEEETARNDVDPAEFARARAELESRLGGLRRSIDARADVGWSVVRADAGGDEQDSRAA